MVRTRSKEKLDQIVAAALHVFVEKGYAGTRVEEIAEAADVAPGTVYLYVDGKESVFELTLKTAFGDPLPDVDRLPYEGEIGPDMVEWIWQRLLEVSSFERLRAAAARERPEGGTAEAEFMGVVEELWNWQSEYWGAIELLEKCAREWPELDMLFYRQFRQELLDLGTRYLESRMEHGLLLRYPDAGTAIRVLAETVTFFAMHRHVRPHTANLEEPVAKETVLTLLERGFLPGEHDGG